MLRVVLTQLLFFLMPFIGYAMWLWFTRKGQTADNWRNGPVFWLILSGLLISIGSFVLMASFDRMPQDKEYRPAEFRDGVLVPGRYE